MNIVFMGTPDFAVPALEMLAQKHHVAAVVTQQDRPKGRGHKIQYPPVKEAALRLDIPVYQPLKVKEQEFVEQLESISPDVIVVIAFGQILSKKILEIPKYGCINIHASILPKYRGAAPIQWAVIDGEKETGVTTMYMEEGLDTGDIIDVVKVPVDEKETGGSLFDKLSKEGATLIIDTLKKVENGSVKRKRQNEEQVTYAGKITKSLGRIDFSQPAEKIERLIRGLNPWPGAYTYMDGKTLKIWAAQVDGEHVDAVCGTILKKNKKGISVATGQGILTITELQPEGKKRMSAEAFLNGYLIKTDCLG